MDTYNPYEAPASYQGMLGVKIVDIFVEMLSLLHITFATITLIAGWIHYDLAGHLYLFYMNIFMTIGVLLLAGLINVKNRLDFHTRLPLEIICSGVVLMLVFLTIIFISL